MLALGGLLVSVALLTLAAVAPVFRSSNPPRWTTRGWIGELVTLAIVCTLAMGLGYLGAGAIAAVQTGVDYLDLGLLGVVLVAMVLAWRKLSARARATAVETDTGGHARPSASGEASRDLERAAGPAPANVSKPPRPPKAA